MDSTLNPKQPDPPDVFARVNEEIVRAYEQVALADEQIARTLAHDGARQAPAAIKNARGPRGRPSFAGTAVRGFIGLLLAACIGVAAMAWQSSYGDAARQMIARRAPQLVLASSPPQENPRLPEQPSSPNVQAPTAEAAPPQAAPPQPALLAQTAPEDVAPPAAALSPELTQLLQSMARDLASMGERIEQLKANQEQMARDNAQAAEQLKASQEQMASVIAKASEQNLRPRISAPPPRSAAAPARKPLFPPRQAAAAPTLPQPAAPSVRRQPKPPPQATAQPQD